MGCTGCGRLACWWAEMGLCVYAVAQEIGTDAHILLHTPNHTPIHTPIHKKQVESYLWLYISMHNKWM